MSVERKLIQHLMGKAGFGATPEELDKYILQGYDGVVESILNPAQSNTLPEDVIYRYHVDIAESRLPTPTAAKWMYRLVTTDSPLEEKIALFWHGLFASNFADVQQMTMLYEQVDMFRKLGLGNFRDLLLELSKDTAMSQMLDNVDNHADAINENWGRELLELFSMGIGNYTEDDVKEASRAFTGWTRDNIDYAPFWPYGRVAWHHKFDSNDHDYNQKTFLGETGEFDGDQIVDIIVKQKATAEFISTRLYQYFCSDEIDSEGKLAINEMMEAYFQSGYEIRSVLRSLFKSEYFKSDKCRSSKVKSPIELVVGTVRISEAYSIPTLAIKDLVDQATFMGQTLFQPPSVEGWHEGVEWIDSGTLIERVNFASSEISNLEKPGVRKLISRVKSDISTSTSNKEILDKCSEIIGCNLSDKTRGFLLDSIDNSPNNNQKIDEHIGQVLGFIAATKEYQLV